MTDILLKEKKTEYVHCLEELERLAASETDEWVLSFERDLQVEQVLSHMDLREREIFARKSTGDSWSDVAKEMGIENAEKARSLFRYGIRKARERLLERVKRPKPKLSER